jgi:hypothetical protein
MSVIERTTSGSDQPRTDGNQTANWWGPESTPGHRAMLGALVTVAVAVIMLALNAFAGVDDWALIIPFIIAAVVVGLYVRHWLAIPAVYVAWVGTLILIDVGRYLVLGASRWEELNAEHWQGSEPAYVNLLLQQTETAFLGLFIGALAGTGALVGWLIHWLLLRG